MKFTLSKKHLIEIGIYSAIIGGLFLFIREKTLVIKNIDKAKRRVTYKWKGEEYTWDWNDFEDYEVAEEIGNEYIISKKSHNPDSVELIYAKTVIYNKGPVEEGHAKAVANF
jgi:hypothetical protein